MSQEQASPDIAAHRLSEQAYEANFADLHPPLDPHEARVAADRCLFCWEAPCVAACPTGIDIRDGLQMECVGCAQCIDACDAVMAKLQRPRHLIRYTSQDELAGCGAGPLEDLIRAEPARVIDRVEDLAGRSAALRDALAAAWVTLADVPEQLARRYVKASGDRLKVLDAPEGWAAG